MSQPLPAPEQPGVEWKVKAATAASYVGGVVALFLLQALSDGYFIDYLPSTVATFVAPLVPAALTFAAGWITKHTPRDSGLGTTVDALIVDRLEVALADLEGRLRRPGADPAPAGPLGDDIANGK